MYYESDARVLSWISEALHHPSRRIRLDAVNLLSALDFADRDEWLGCAMCDKDPVVVATAALVQAQVRVMGHRFDLFESDLGCGLDSPDLQWEWEYSVVVCHGVAVPGATTLVWTREEDDALARNLAVMKVYVGKEHESQRARPLIVSKRLVTRFTRSPRSSAEARKWHAQGRPRYQGDQE